MSQADFTIANQTFPNTRAEINTSLQALATNSAGNSAPSTTFANQWWFDSDDNKLYMRNKDDDAWVEILTIGATSDKVETLTATTINGIPFHRGDGNNTSIYTHDVSATDSTAQYNTGYGINALDAITTGDKNTAIGSAAGSAINTATDNTLVGYESGASITSGVKNVAVGTFALDAANTGQENTAIGHQALTADTKGQRNVAIGHGTLATQNFTGATNSHNVAIGYNAGNICTTGQSNVLIGALAGDGFDAESDNLAIGRSALSGGVDGGEFNVAVGNYTLDALTSADSCTAVGYQAGSAKTSGNHGTFIGYNAGLLVTTGTDVTFVGSEAGDGHDTESYNTGVGSGALGGPISGGEYNTAVGAYTLDALTSGNSNVAVGYAAGGAITTGPRNVCLGESAGGSIISGEGNVCIGQNSGNAGVSLTTGDNNILIGEKISAGGAGNHRQIVIGTEGTTGKGDNTAFISANGGDTFNGANRTTWDQASDRRIKKNIVDNNTGLDAINKIQVRNFEYRTLEEITDFDHPASAMVDKQGKQLGVIAQELEEILPDLITETSQGVKTLNADNLTWYLINAVKELSAEIKVLKGE
jgi:hypothetical protein